MNSSTEGVTLFAAFVNDVLRNYQDKKELYQDLFDMVEPYDLTDPFNKVPMQLYNDMCAWIEEELGKFNLIRVGKNIGETVWGVFEQNKMIAADAGVVDIMKALKVAADNMIQDPLKRGWEILEEGEKYLIMRRTQTFNSKLQLGLLNGLASKSPGVYAVNVDYVKSVDSGDEFDEFKITWMKD